MIKHIILFLNLFLILFTLASNNILAISEVNLVILSGMIVLDYFDKKSLSFFQTWLVGFIFIILSEAILIKSGNNILEAVKFLLIANNLVILGYYIPVKFKRKKRNNVLYQAKISKWTPYILILLVGVYVLRALPSAILTYSVGRDYAAEILFKNSNLILDSLSGALGLVLPSIIVFYYKEIKKKKSILIPLLLSTPIFVLLFIGGTRFTLLFSLGGFLIVSQTNNTGRITLNVKLISLLLLLIFISTLMGQFRSGGLANFEFKQEQSVTETRLSKRIASEMDPEGVVDMTALSMTYFETNPHTYGKSIAFLTYFWVPRAIWPDKPTMIGHWLIRKYRSGFGEGHSASFGFTGELYADFGYFSLFFVFLLGMLLKWADLFRANQLSQPMSYSKILVGMMFSYVFFFVRSPVTATINFIGILVVYYLIHRLIFKKII